MFIIIIIIINIGRRIASSFDNFLVFGANVKENSTVVRHFILKLMSDIKFIENEVFKVVVSGKEVQVEFKLESLPNDMKMLAFLGGKLKNSAYYFCTFANVNQEDSNNVKKAFSINGSK